MKGSVVFGLTVLSLCGTIFGITMAFVAATIPTESAQTVVIWLITSMMGLLAAGVLIWTKLNK